MSSSSQGSAPPARNFPRPAPLWYAQLPTGELRCVNGHGLTFYLCPPPPTLPGRG